MAKKWFTLTIELEGVHKDSEVDVEKILHDEYAAKDIEVSREGPCLRYRLTSGTFRGQSWDEFQSELKKKLWPIVDETVAFSAKADGYPEW
jgi:hypothetical protein